MCVNKNSRMLITIALYLQSAAEMTYSSYTDQIFCTPIYVYISATFITQWKAELLEWSFETVNQYQVRWYRLAETILYPNKQQKLLRVRPVKVVCVAMFLVRVAARRGDRKAPMAASNSCVTRPDSYTVPRRSLSGGSLTSWLTLFLCCN